MKPPKKGTILYRIDWTDSTVQKWVFVKTTPVVGHTRLSDRWVLRRFSDGFICEIRPDENIFALPREAREVLVVRLEVETARQRRIVNDAHKEIRKLTKHLSQLEDKIRANAGEDS